MVRIYEKSGITVSTSRVFIYSEEIYKRTPRSYNILRKRFYTSEKPIIRNEISAKIEDYKYDPETKIAIIREWELISAPEQYLIDNNFKRKQ